MRLATEEAGVRSRQEVAGLDADETDAKSACARDYYRTIRNNLAVLTGGLSEAGILSQRVPLRKIPTGPSGWPTSCR